VTKVTKFSQSGTGGGTSAIYGDEAKNDAARRPRLAETGSASGFGTKSRTFAEAGKCGPPPKLSPPGLGLSMLIQSRLGVSPIQLFERYCRISRNSLEGE